MPAVSLGASATDRKTAWTPEVRLVNYLPEQSPTNPYTGVDYVQRPGLAPFATVGAGPIRSVYRQAGTFGGDFLVASALVWYRVTSAGVATSLGAITGTDRTSTAATSSRAITVAGAVAYSTNGTTVAAVVMPDGRSVGSVAQLNGYFILPELGSARFYWIEPGQTNPDGLSFATTESSPGDIIKVERVGDELWFMKEEGMEVWQPTGDPDIPFQRIPGRNYDKGARARDAICRFDNSLAWVGNDGVVYRADSNPIRISTNSIEERIRKADRTSLSQWSYAVDGHLMLVISMNIGTWAFDASSEQWIEFESYNLPKWRAHVGDYGTDFVVAGDYTNNRLYRLDPERSNDNGDPLVRVLGGGIAVPGGGVMCDSLFIYVTTGTALSPIDRPSMQVRWSDNARIYGDPRNASLKVQGDYSEPVRLTRLGRMTYPGRLFEFIVTDDLVATISGAAYNVPLD